MCKRYFLQVLKLDGENAGERARRNVQNQLISNEEFQAYLHRHASVPELVAENNATMQSSYILLDESMR
jgi:radical S-adenosyl methionine domain-containing protein 2